MARQVRVWVTLLLGMLLASACGAGEKAAPESTADAARPQTAEPMKPAPKRVVAGMMAPAWSGTDLVSGEQVDFPATLAGGPAVLVFWATWCPYCKVFMPYAKAIEADYGERGVQIVTFNAKERGRGDPAAYAKGLGFPLLAIAEADGIAGDYGIDFIPGLLVVDGDGKVVYRRRSTELPAGQTVAELWDDEVRQVLDTLVAPKAAEA